MTFDGFTPPDKVSANVALLYQMQPPPIIDGCCKPMKPGGYRDSSLDVAYALRKRGWSLVDAKRGEANLDSSLFPDTKDGISKACAAGATIIWANTVLYKQHPLRTISCDQIAIVGQDPTTTEHSDNKWNMNRSLRKKGLPVVSSLLIEVRENNLFWHDAPLSSSVLRKHGINFPCIIKPVRGRGSEGVTRVNDLDMLCSAAINMANQVVSTAYEIIPKYGSFYLVEAYLQGQEITVTVMPPGLYQIGDLKYHKPKHWALRPVTRTEQRNGIIPYNGKVPVTANSQVVNNTESASSRFQEIIDACSHVGELIESRAPIRIDCRANESDQFYLFDVNMKPNITGPGRTGRGNQEGLMAMAARAEGMDYAQFVENILLQAWPSRLMR